MTPLKLLQAVASHKEAQRTPGRSTRAFSLWMPGLRAQGPLSFGVTAVPVSLCLALLIGLLTFMQLQTALQEHQTLRQQRAGLHTLMRAYPVMQATQQLSALRELQRAEDETTNRLVAQARERLGTALQDLQHFQDDAQTLMSATLPHWSALQSAVRLQLNGYAGAAGQVPETALAALAYIQQVSRSSGLLMDSDPRDAHLVQAAVQLPPELLVAASQVRRLGVELLTRDDSARLHPLTDRLARLEAGLDGLAQAYAAVQQQQPELAGKLGAVPVIKGLRELHQAAHREAVYGAGTASAASFHAWAGPRLSAAYGLTLRSLQALDGSLEAQQKRLKAFWARAGVALLLGLAVAGCLFITFHGVTRSE